MKGLFLRLALLVSLACGGLTAHAAPSINSLRIWPAPDHTRLVFDLSGPVNHKVFSLDNPKRLVIDINQVNLNTQLNSANLANTPINRLRSAVRNGQDLRVVLDLTTAIQPRSFLLKPNEQYGHRLVVDLVLAQPQIAQPAPTSRPAPRQDRPIIIALDPGHGGEDPGAIGPGGTREKHLVWSLAQELAKSIERNPDFKTILTRDGDYYVGLRQRVEVARQAKADLFISIHADAYRLPQPRGSSVYVLSQRGVTSESARWLADSENRADLIGGVEGVLTLGDKDETLVGVLVDLSMTATLAESLNVGARVLQNLGKVNRLHKRDVEQAGFLVLKSPDMPSMLIEAGFISNPQEEKRLRDPVYQRQLATQIAKAVQDYFQENPPPNTSLAKRQAKQPSAYVIRRGDTLSEIARKNGVDLGELRKLNNITNDVIQVGQRLRIPSS